MTTENARVLLGIDTGGTFTDAVLLREDQAAPDPSGDAVLAKAKALTTPANLALGIGSAVRSVLAEGRIDPGQVALVSLSTTLATNALVEGQGGRAGLVMIGFEDKDIARQGLGEALGEDPVIRLAGGHDAMGAEQAPLDLAPLDAALAHPVDAYAVCAHFAVRNPAHETRAAAHIRAVTGAPVTCSHDLSAKVGGPKRGLTALLNARLIGLIAQLIDSAEGLMADLGLSAPLMVVRGDGALVSAAFARARPIETILSGPAASLVGAGWLTGQAQAVVSDIGGTTTDIAVIRDGRPRIDPDGARVGGLSTMVEAVAMRTHGLGGDSAVGLSPDGLEQNLTLGPGRLIPVSLLAEQHGAIVHAHLDRQLSARRAGEAPGRFLLRHREDPGLEGRDAALLARLGTDPVPEDGFLANRMERMALKRLIARGLVRRSGFTPSDAAHVLGLYDAWDRAAARKAADLFALTRGNHGRAIAPGGEQLSERVIARLTRLSAERVLETALAEDGFPEAGLPTSTLAAAALDGHSGLTAPRLSLTVPLIGLGASAPAYYPGIARLLDAPAAVPAHADVANAIGAVVGRVRLSLTGTVSTPNEGVFRAHLPSGPQDFTDQDVAETALAEALSTRLRQDAQAAGADGIDLTAETNRRMAEIEGQPTLVEAEITVTATGRPRLAEPPADPTLVPGFRGV